MINLTACVNGQKLRLRDGRIATYAGLTLNDHYPHKTILLQDENVFYTYKDNGSYHCDYGSHYCDVVEILPLETTETASHPSVAWWESCPWITDRKPTEKDGDESGWVMAKLIDSSSASTTYWPKVKAGDPWVHRPLWKPPALTDKEQAVELINNHSPEGNGIVEDNWKPTPEQWHIILKGLEAL